MEIVGARALLCPTTIALCPPRHLLAAATAARGGNNSGGGGSQIDVIRLWREDGEDDVGRPFKRLASIRDCDGPFHRLAWSRGEASSEYRLGLLAGGLDGGSVRIWDPSRLLYEPDLDTTKANLYGGRRSSWSEDDGSLSSASLSFIMNGFDGMPKSVTVVGKKTPPVQFQDAIEKVATGMIKELDPVIENHRAQNRKLEHDAKGESKEWELVPSEEIVSNYTKVDSKEWEFVPNEITSNDMWNCLVLKLDKLTGPVMGLSFNNQYPNMLASAAYGETLNIYNVDCPNEFATRGSKQLETQMMFLEWHPFFPAILASTCDAGYTKMWDLREKSSKCTYKQDERKCICTEVHWNPSNPWMLAAASKDSLPIKIWDTRQSQRELFEFGKGKGVASFSWSPCGQIITTNIDGAIDCCKLDKNWEPSRWSMSVSGVCEAQWCQSESTLASVFTENLVLYKMPADGCYWPSWKEKTMKDSPWKAVLI